MAMIWQIVGAVTDTGATFSTKVDTGPVRIAVADNPNMADPQFFGPEAVDSTGVAQVTATGLDPDTRHWWAVEDDGVLSTTVGQVLTDPPVGSAASFTVAIIGDAGLDPATPGVTGDATTRLSNDEIFDIVRTQALAGNWRRTCHVGDACYYDLGSGNHGLSAAATVTQYRTMWDDIFAQPRQLELFYSCGLHWQWDDHEFATNNSDRTAPGRENALQVAVERIPMHALDGSNGIYRSWQIGRVLFVALDCRYNRDPNSDPQSPSKTMLGTAQKAWLDNVLATSTARALVVLSSSPWTGAAQDTWAGFTHERDELAQMFTDRGWADRMVMCHADRHALGIDSGATNPFGGFPLLQAAAMDASPASTPAPGRFDILADTPGRRQYGTVTVQDDGTVLTIRLTGWSGTTELGHYTLAIEEPPDVLAGAFHRSLRGSHTATFEARVLSQFQTGSDPDGVTIPIKGGRVEMDATAKTQRILELETPGVAEDDALHSIFPRRATDLLGPYGNEIWVRRGIDIGPTTLWIPLGYYRIDAVEQSDSPYGLIRLSCSDRMQGIVDARPLQPKEFPPTRSVAALFAEVVGDVYPDAVILFDDDSAAATIGRTLVMDDSRYTVLAEVATSLGKIMFWDGNGLLRVMTAPAEDNPLWEIRAGRNGVLVKAGRRVTREGVYNAVVATGEAGQSDVPPVIGIAVDNGPNSPTRYGGRFGKIPRFYSSPFIKNSGQAETAAIELLRNSIGLPYAVDFGSIVNPILKPYDPVRITQQDGNREIHIMERLTIPLTAKPPMTGSTREKTLVSIGGRP